MKLIWPIAAILGVLLILGTVFFGRFTYFQVCQNCGAVQKGTDWHIPMTDFIIFKSSSVEESELSKVVHQQNWIQETNHAWLFGHGGGNGVRCAIGEGERIHPNVTSTNVANFLLSLKSHCSQDTFDRWFGCIRKTDGGISHFNFVFLQDYDRGKLDSKEAFRAWLKTEEDERKFLEMDKR